MLLFLEIIFTIMAWNKGWKAKALIPVAASLVGGFLIGFFIGLSGGSVTGTVQGFVIIIDVLATIAVGIMAFVKPKK